MQELPDRPPEIDYPARWGYRLIGPDTDALRAAVAEVVGERDHELRPSNTSAGGKYHSFALELVVDDEAQRLGFFEAFRAHPAVVYVL